MTFNITGSEAVIGAIATAALGLVVRLYVQKSAAKDRRKESHASLEVKLLAASQRIRDLENETASLKQQVQTVQTQLTDHFGHEATLAKYKFDRDTGTYGREAIHYCTSCLVRTPQVQSPMKKDDGVWKCSVCPATYADGYDHSLLDKYHFDSASGICSHLGIHYCTSCLFRTPSVASPLHLSDGRWKCSVCPSTFDDKTTATPSSAS